MERQVIKLNQINYGSEAQRQYHTPFHFDVDGGILFLEALDHAGYKIHISKSDNINLSERSPEELQKEIMLLTIAVQQMLAELSSRPRWATRNGEFLWNESNNLIFEIENNGMRSEKNNRGRHNINLDLKDSDAAIKEPHVKIYHRRLENGQMTDVVICQADVPVYTTHVDGNYKEEAARVALYLRAILRVLILRKNINLDMAAQAQSIGQRTSETRVTMAKVLQSVTSKS